VPIVTFVLADGSQRVLALADGTTLMAGAVQNDVPGILGDCGGSCVCATCHVYVHEAFTGALPPPGDGEADLLDCVAAERRSNSRLGCQIRLSFSLDGLIVTVPERQL